MGLTALEALARHGYDIAAVFTHENDPDENQWFGSVKDWAVQRNIAVYTTEEVNSPPWVAKIAAINPDIIISCYYRKMISRQILDLPRVGAFNLHGSFLPAYRGRCPVNWVIIKGEKQTGVTLHYMIEKPDAGDIVGQKAVEIDLSDTAKTLYDKLCAAAQELLDELLPLMKRGQIPRQKQDLTQGSYYGGRRPEDGRIDWKKSADEIYNLIRGVTDPYPGAFAFLDNDEKMIVWRAAPAASAQAALPGQLVMTDKEVLVQTDKNAIKLLDIEIKGRRLNGEQINSYLKNEKVKELK